MHPSAVSPRDHRLLRKFASFAVASTLVSSAAAALNDDFIDARLLDLGGRLAQDVSGFSRESGETGTGGTNSRTAWYAWTAPEGGPAVVRFSTYGSNYDTVIRLFKEDPTNPTPLVTSLLPVAAPELIGLVDDDTAINVQQGYVTWAPIAGTTYYISVGRNGNANSNVLEATFAAVTGADLMTPLIPNDPIAGALEFAAIPAAGQIPRGELVPGTTIGATAETGEQSIDNAPTPRGGTVWYKYRTGAIAEKFSVVFNGIPTETKGEVTIQVFENTVAPTLPTFVQLDYIEDDEQSSLTGTPRVMVDGDANTEYYFRVTSTGGNDSGDGVNFNIRLDFNPTAPANDLIAAAAPLEPTLPSVRNLGEDIYSATTADVFPGETSGNNIWYTWKAPFTGAVRLRSIAPTATAGTGNFESGSSFRYDAEVYFDTTNPTDPVFDFASRQNVAGFDDDDQQQLSFYAIKDVVYYIEIGGDNDINPAGRGFVAFVLEDNRLTETARTGVSYGPEGVLKTIDAPVVNRQGDLAFSATFELGGPIDAKNDSGLFLFNNTNTRVVATEGSEEYGSTALFGTFSNLFLADRATANDGNADLGFNATLTGSIDDKPVTAKNNRGFFQDDPANPGVLEFRLGDYVGTSETWGDGGGFLGAFNTPVRQTNDNIGLVTGRMVAIPKTRDTAIFATTQSVVLQEEDPAPGTTDGVEIGDITGIPSVNAADAMAFRVVLRGTDVTAKNDTAIYTVADFNADPTALNYVLRLREGSAISETIAGGATLLSLGEPRINPAGKIATLVSFKANTGTPAATKTTDTAIVSDLLSSDLTFSIVAREGDSVRDENGAIVDGVRFASFTAPVLITSNAVIFTAKVAGTGVTAANDNGIWIWDGAAVYQVAREGQVAPGLVTPGPTFKTLGIPLANPSGRVAFTATLAGAGVDKTNDAGLWTVLEDGLTPSLRLRKGDEYDFGRTELPVRRTITSISVTTGSGGDDGFPRGMDQDGNVAVVVGLAKGTAKAGQAAFKVTP